MICTASALRLSSLEDVVAGRLWRWPPCAPYEGSTVVSQHSGPQRRQIAEIPCLVRTIMLLLAGLVGEWKWLSSSSRC